MPPDLDEEDVLNQVQTLSKVLRDPDFVDNLEEPGSPATTKKRKHLLLAFKEIHYRIWENVPGVKQNREKRQKRNADAGGALHVPQAIELTDTLVGHILRNMQVANFAEKMKWCNVKQ
jgi:hypothetical protein